MKSILGILLVVLGAIIQESSTSLSNFDKCPKKLDKSIDLDKKADKYFLVLRSTVYDTAKCYRWKVSEKNKIYTLNQTANVMDTPTTKKFEMTMLKNGTYEVKLEGKVSTITSVTKSGEFIIVYNCKKDLATTLLPGVYSKQPKEPTASEFKSIMAELKKNEITEKMVEKIAVSKCKY